MDNLFAITSPQNKPQAEDVVEKMMDFAFKNDLKFLFINAIVMPDGKVVTSRTRHKLNPRELIEMSKIVIEELGKDISKELEKV